jgi:hypothetical protein
LSVLRYGSWFTLARYHDVDRLKNGPKALATFLGQEVNAVFPISYDLRHAALGDADALVGQVLEEPHTRLSRSEIIALAAL